MQKKMEERRLVLDKWTHFYRTGKPTRLNKVEFSAYNSKEGEKHQEFVNDFRTKIASLRKHTDKQFVAGTFNAFHKLDLIFHKLFVAGARPDICACRDFNFIQKK